MNNVETDGSWNWASICRVPKDAAKSRYLLARGDVLFNATNSPNLVGKSAFFSGLDEPIVFSNHFLRLRPHGEKLDGRYLARWLNHLWMTRLFETRCTQWVNQASYRKEELLSLEIPLPPLAEQKRIAGILDAADALRAKRREALAQLDTLLQATFLDLFGDPVTNPKAWDGHCFDDLLTLVQYGPRFFNEAYTPTGIRIVRITDLDSQGNLDFSAMPRLEVSTEDVDSYALRPGDLILARTGATVGKTALVRPSDPKCIAGAYFIRLRFKSDVTPLYVQWVMKSRGVQAIIWQKSQQSAQPNFNGPAIRRLPLPVPPIEIQNRFAMIVASIENQIARMRAHLAELDTLFASLQSRAFRGEL